MITGVHCISLILNILYSDQVRTAVQNSSIGSGQGSEQQSDTKRDMGGESSESLPGRDSETGNDKVHIWFYMDCSHIGLNAKSSFNQPQIVTDNIYRDTGRSISTPDLPTCSGSKGSEFVGRNEENFQSQASCEKSTGTGSSQAVPLGLGLGGLERPVRCYLVFQFRYSFMLVVTIRFLFGGLLLNYTRFAYW